METGPVEGPWDLPEGWEWKALGSLSTYVSRGRGPKYVVEDGQIVINQKCVRWWGLELQHAKLTSREAAAKLDQAQFIQPWDLLWNSTGTGTIGRAALVDEDDLRQPLVVDSHVTIVRPDREKALPKWLHYWIQTNSVQRTVEGTGSTNQVELSKGQVLGTEVPVSPLDTQRRIVARIDELFSELDDGEAALARARADLETYRKSLLKAAVTGELTADWRAANPPTETGEQLLQRILADRKARWEADPKNKGRRYQEPSGPEIEGLPELPDGWAWATLQQLGDFGRGKSKHRPRNDPRLYGGGIPFVQTGIVANSSGRITNYEQTYSELGLAQSKLWPAGTLCITIAANIAKTGVLTFDACFPDSIVGLSCDEGVEPAYIELVIRTVQENLERYAPATAQKNINLEVLEQVALPIPSTSEQDRIIELVGEMFGAADLLVRNAFDMDIAKTRQSILAAAFRGELVQ